MEPETITKNLPCSLTNMERDDRARSAALLTTRTYAKERENKAEAKQRKEELEALNAELESLAEVANSGVEYREVTCHLEFDCRAWMATLYRDDTGEVVETRPMSKGERYLAQQKLQID